MSDKSAPPMSEQGRCPDCGAVGCLAAVEGVAFSDQTEIDCLRFTAERLRGELAEAQADVEHWIAIARKRHEERKAAESGLREAQEREAMLVGLLREARGWVDVAARQSPTFYECKDADRLLDRIDAALSGQAESKDFAPPAQSLAENQGRAEGPKGDRDAD